VRRRDVGCLARHDHPVERTLLSGGSVLDVASGEVFQADVVLAGDRIAAVGSGLDGDVVMDGRGHLLVPGFIDCHTHIALTQRLDAAAPHRLPRSAHWLAVVPVLRLLLRREVTTIRDAWGADAGVRWAVQQGWMDRTSCCRYGRSARPVALVTRGLLGWVRSTSSIPRFPIRALTAPIRPAPRCDGWCERVRTG
jgi:predicted amidohydrolase YtcJ